MKSLILDRFTNGDIRSVLSISLDSCNFIEQKLDVTELQNNIIKQIDILEQLKSDVSNDINNPKRDYLINKISNKITELKEMI